MKEIPQDTRVVPLLDTIVEEMNNSVPNLRFTSCRILTNLRSLLPEKVKSKAIEQMTQLLKDEDRDVRYYAAQGLKAFNEM